MKQVAPELLDGATVWRKTYSGSERRFLKWLLRGVCRLLGIRALLPVKPQSAAQQCQTEVEQITRLGLLGIRVPQVIDVQATALTLSDLGPTLSHSCARAQSPEQRHELLAQGLAAIRNLHRLGGNASQPVLRNLTVADGGIGFIDLEEDPLSVMPLACAQARDTLLFVQSAARYLQDQPERFAALLSDHLAQESSAVRAEIELVVRRLGWAGGMAAWCGSRGRAIHAALVHLRRGIGTNQLASFTHEASE